jgi:hypothetical protein
VRDAYYTHLADPGPDSWRAICRLLSDKKVPAATLVAEARDLKRELAAWPPEVERPKPDRWPAVGATPVERELAEARAALCRVVREVDLYDHYVRAAREAPALRLRDGTPAVRLQRQFTGALQGSHGKRVRIGKRGSGDLSGSICVEWAVGGGSRSESGWRRISIACEVEVKRAAEEQREEQMERENALRRRGEVYVLARRTDEMVRALVAERGRLTSLVLGCGLSEE